MASHKSLTNKHIKYHGLFLTGKVLKHKCVREREKGERYDA
jgi:hypothetical protein